MWIRETALLPPLRRLAPDFGEQRLCAAIDRSNGEPIPTAVTLSLLIPGSPAAEREADLARLFREIACLARRIDRDRDVAELVVDASELRGSLRHFPWSELLAAIEHQYYVAPRTARTILARSAPVAIEPEDAVALKSAGFNRFAVSAGPAELQAVGVAHRSGFDSVACRLDADGARTPLHAALTAAREVRPERLEITAARDLMPCALEAQGYAYIGPGQFALENDELALASRAGRLRFGMFGYTATRESDVVGMGPGAFSQVGDCIARNAPDVASWRNAVDAGRLPVSAGLMLGPEDRLRDAVMQALLCRRTIPVHTLETEFGCEFRSHFAAQLARLRALPSARYLRDTGGHIDVHSPGWPWLRTMALCFDVQASRLH